MSELCSSSSSLDAQAECLSDLLTTDRVGRVHIDEARDELANLSRSLTDENFYQLVEKIYARTKHQVTYDLNVAPESSDSKSINIFGQPLQVHSVHLVLPGWRNALKGIFSPGKGSLTLYDNNKPYFDRDFGRFRFRHLQSRP
ncbi:MAG: hypothetical protein KC777_14645 [Cyanobacteria bacterium HKST-UBA02]|nr:hypothetical protein [Cyanobacteria bacterium HKST-UBA02]